MGLLQGLALGAKNEALLLLSMSARTMVFATNVLVVMLVAGLFGVEGLRRTKLIAGLLLAVGSGLEGWGTVEKMRHGGEGLSSEPLGCALALLALVLDALRWVLLQAVFARKSLSAAPVSIEERAEQEHSAAPASGESCRRDGGLRKAAPVSRLRMVSLVMWATTPVCLGLAVIFEPRGIRLASQRPSTVSALVAVLTLGVLCINLSEFLIVQWTSAVTFNVLSQLHSIPLILAGVCFFGEEIAPMQVLGFSVCLAGAFVYSFAKSEEKP